MCSSDLALAAVRAEVADVLLYLIRISDKLGIDLIAAANAKIQLNAEKYPVDKARGSGKKYTELGLNFPVPWNNGLWNLITTQLKPR